MSGDEALRMIKARVREGQVMYKALFVDYSMPEMDGPTFTRELAKFCKFFDIEMPLVCCCTAYTEVNFKEKAFNAGMK